MQVFPMSTRFIYFDLGNVLLNFSHRRACEQMGVVAGVSADRVWKVLFESGLEQRFEAGQLDNAAFYEEFCAGIGGRPDFNQLMLAGSDIFEVNAPMLPLVAQLRAAGHRMGILSNTCLPHWTYCMERNYSPLRMADSAYALSYKIGCIKPDPRIFQAAAELAKCVPEEIFFTDDIPSHVEAARAAGWDAEPFTTVPRLVEALHARGIQSNY
jgi:putative hydrolase of the HAD superfamily